MHIAVGDNMWVSEMLNAVSLEVDPVTGQCGVCPLDVDHKSQDYYYGPDGTDDPGYIPGHIFRSTNAPAYWSHYNDHAGIPNMLTPPQNPMLTGTVCVVKGSVDVGDPIPHQENDPAVAISYGVAPAETILASEPDAIVVEVYYPPDDHFKKRWEFSGGQGLSGSFYWDGLLDLYDDYGNLFATNVGYCPCSTVFARISVKVKDRYWTIYGIQEPIREWTWEMPRISIVQPQWDSLFMVTDPAEMILLASPSVTASVSDAEWSGGEDPPTGGGSSFTTAFRLKIDEQWIKASLEGMETLLKLLIAGVDKVEWLELTDGTGGKLESGFEAEELRIFPDWTLEDVNNKPNPEDRPNRRRVELKATLKPALADLTVYFRVIDVDDPSTSVAPVDANDQDANDPDLDGSDIDGGDNRGTAQWAVSASYQNQFPGTSFTVVDGPRGIVSKRTDATGVCCVIFEVSPNPGDNFRGVASISLARSQDVNSGTTEGMPATVYYNYKDRRRFFNDWPDRLTWATDKYLAVWRRLHVECDTMSALPDDINLVRGRVVSTQSGSGKTTVTIQRIAGDAVAVEDRFVSGRLFDTVATTCYEIEHSTAGETFLLRINGTPNLPQDRNVQVYDDDFNLSTCPPSSRNLLPSIPSLSIAQTVYRKAYIEVDDAGGVWNSVISPEPYHPLAILDAQRGSINKGGAWYWVSYALSAFQYFQDLSSDPEAPAVSGSTVDRTQYPGWGGCTVYVETHRDRNAALGISPPLGMTVAHEIAHSIPTVGPGHADTARLIISKISNREFKVQGTLPIQGLNIVHGAIIFVLDPNQTAPKDVLARGKLASYSNEADSCIISLLDDLRFEPRAPRQDYQIGDVADIFSKCVMGQFEGVEYFCPTWLDKLRSSTTSPLP